MKIKGFKLEKNKRFNYTPRHYQGKDLGNPYKFDERIRKTRETVTTSMNSEWINARKQSRNRNNSEVNKTLIIVFLILCFIALYLLDFDLSIFLKRR